MNRKYPNKQYKTKVGENIFYWRRLKGFKQEDLAKRIGISTTALSNIENGNSKPDIERLEDIADALEIETAQLLQSPQQMLILHNNSQSNYGAGATTLDKVLIERLTTVIEKIITLFTAEKK